MISWPGVEAFAVRADPEFTPAFLTRKKVGWLRMGIGSALTRKLLIRVEGPSPVPDDDLIIEAKEVVAFERDSCVSIPHSSEPFRVVEGLRQIGRFEQRLVVALPGLGTRPDVVGWWVRDWERSCPGTPDRRPEVPRRSSRTRARRGRAVGRHESGSIPRARGTIHTRIRERLAMVRLESRIRQVAQQPDGRTRCTRGSKGDEHEPARLHSRDRSRQTARGRSTPMSQITLTVNGKRQTVDVEPTTPLLYVLRNDLGLQGPRFGCGLGQCGACTVIIKGEAVRSCIRPVSAVAGAEITTLEGPGGGRHAASPAAGLDRRAGAAVRVLPERADPHREGAARQESRIRPTRRSAQAMATTLCRCMTYYRVQAAIKRVAEGERMSRLTPRLPQEPPACWSSASARCQRWRPTASATR